MSLILKEVYVYCSREWNPNIRYLKPLWRHVLTRYLPSSYPSSYRETWLYGSPATEGLCTPLFRLAIVKVKGSGFFRFINLATGKNT